MNKTKILEIALGIMVGGVFLAAIVWFYMTLMAMSAQIQTNTQNINSVVNFINQFGAKASQTK